MKEAYYFGRGLAKEIELFAYPRTGSHFLFYCLSGLFDLVSREHQELHNQEAISRQAELNEAVLYALDLREDGVPYQPVRIDALSNGIHGLPRTTQKPQIILIRDPIATLYSLFRTGTERWGMVIPDLSAWLGKTAGEYEQFYTEAFNILSQENGKCLLVRYEALVEGPNELKKIVDFVNVKPKLTPDFVYQITKFETFVRPGERTFYRSGDNHLWRQDSRWIEALRSIEDRDFAAFGYKAVSAY
jgi:hypothetical protein